jgi:hypothetical protein
VIVVWIVDHVSCDRVVSFWGRSDRYFRIGGAWHVEVSERHSLDC